MSKAEFDATLTTAIDALPPEQRPVARQIAEVLARASFIQQQNAAAYMILVALDRAPHVSPETRQDIWRQVITTVCACAEVNLLESICKCATGERVATDDVIAAIGHELIARANTERLRLGNLAQVLLPQEKS